MYVSPQTLDMHMRVLRRHFELVHLDDWIREAAAGSRLPRVSCALTFDDGWRDNHEYAFPVLLRHRVPATIFLVSSLVGSTVQFWPERLRTFLVTQPLDAPLPGRLGHLLADVRARVRGKGGWTVEDLDLAITAAKDLDDRTISETLSVWCAEESATASRKLLNAEEVTEMASSGLIRFGSHTRTHHRCRDASPDETLYDEIANSRDEIRGYSKKSVELFCFPDGAITARALDLVRVHYLAAVTTRRGWHRRNRDRYQISRVGLHEDVSGTPAGLLGRLSCVF